MRFLLALSAVAALSALVCSSVGAQSMTITQDNYFGYIPLTAFGGNTVLSLTDDSISNLDVPTFTYAGETWSKLGISSNGYLVVGGSNNPANNTSINTMLPNGSAPGNILAPFWTDLNPEAGGSVLANVLTDGVNDWTVIEWNNVRNASDNTTNTFQVWIGDNGAEDVTFAYDHVGNGNNGLVTIGAMEKTKTVGATYYYNGAGTPPPGSAANLRVTTSGLPSNIPEPGTIALLAFALPVVGLVKRRKA